MWRDVAFEKLFKSISTTVATRSFGRGARGRAFFLLFFISEENVSYRRAGLVRRKRKKSIRRKIQNNAGIVGSSFKKCGLFLSAVLIIMTRITGYIFFLGGGSEREIDTSRLLWDLQGGIDPGSIFNPTFSFSMACLWTTL